MIKKYVKKFPCKASLRVEIGSSVFDDSRLVKFFIKPGNSADIKLKDAAGQEVGSGEISEIRFDLWVEQLEDIITALQKKLV